MDRNYYYRILGLTEGATGQQIRQAYESRMAKLDSADYKDDPEYVTKKKHQTTEAYRVLTGSVPPSTGAQRKARFEKFKDYIEQKESGGKSSGSFKTSGKTKYALKNNRMFFAAAVISIAFLVIAVIGAMFMGAEKLTENLDFFGRDDDNSYDYGGSDGYDDYDVLGSYGGSIENEEKIDEIHDRISETDYYENLNMSAVQYNIDNVDWLCGIGEYSLDGYGEYTEVMNNIAEIMYSLGIEGTEGDFLSYIIGGYGDYYNYDDFACAVILISWMGAPEFDEIAGSVNLYSGEPILDIADYLNYLGSAVYEEI